MTAATATRRTLAKAAARADNAVRVVLPPQTRAGAEAVIAVRLAELAEDLGLPSIPPLLVTEGERPEIRIGNAYVRPPREPRRTRHRSEPEPAAMLGERLASALIASRWHLLQPALQSDRLPLTEATLVAAALGAKLSDIRSLGEAVASDPSAAAWVIAERLPRDAALLTKEPDRWTDLRTVKQLATELSGLDLLEPKVVRSPGLLPGTIRYRLRGFRGPVVAADPRDAMANALLYARQAAVFMDPVAVTDLLLRADRGSEASIADVLRHAAAPRLADSLRPLMQAGFGVPDVPALIRAVLAPKASQVHHSLRRVVLPGYMSVSDPTDDLGDRMRAASVPGALLTRVGGTGQSLSVWFLPPKLAKSFAAGPPSAGELDAFASAAQPAAGGHATALLVPTGHARQVRGLLADDLPDLLVVETQEVPAALTVRQRGTIEVQREET